jgi:polyisoprenoid-binding protein YceI
MVLGSEWQIDDHSNTYFSIQHLTVSKVRGSFNTFSGNATIDDKTGYLTCLNVTVVVNSIDTGVAKREGDLRSQTSSRWQSTRPSPLFPKESITLATTSCC